jgi:hypothetical protein
MFTVHALVNKQTLPLVYALLPDKKQETYTRFFQMLADYIVNEPIYISTDFEQGILNALRTNYPNAILNGCFFHLAQNLWKHVQTNGLVGVHSSNPSFRQSFKQLEAIAFVPQHDVVLGINFLKRKSCEEFRPILDYFESYYVGKLQPGNSFFSRANLSSV